ncbi:MAG: hypothetical protein GWN00_01360 [Aliifodinibius sp.]|nr:hypothetical protein [Fodinibius sp.]NIV09980.1 hypothetical protein [Fodinibius sp.]NIY23510.1 hypothetical protein [Fodinibius sp.]
MVNIHIRELLEGSDGVAGIPSKHPTRGNSAGDLVIAIGGPNGVDVVAYELEGNASPATGLPDTIASLDGATQANSIARGLPQNVPPGITIQAATLPTGWTLKSSVGFAWEWLTTFYEFMNDPVGLYYDGKLYSVSELHTRSYDYTGDNTVEQLDDMPTPSVNTDASLMAWAARASGYLHMLGNGDAAGATNEHFMLDCTLETWAAKAVLPAARKYGAAFELGGKVYFAGGKDSSDVDTLDVYEYDPTGNSWSTMATTCPAAFLRGTQIRIPGETTWAYIATDVGLYRYRRDTDTWDLVHATAVADNHSTLSWYDPIEDEIWIVTGSQAHVVDPATQTYRLVSSIGLTWSPGSSAFWDMGNAMVLFNDYGKRRRITMGIQRYYSVVVKD